MVGMLIRNFVWISALSIPPPSSSADAHELLELGPGDVLVAGLPEVGLDALDQLLGGAEGFPGDDHHVLGVDEEALVEHRNDFIE